MLKRQRVSHPGASGFHVCKGVAPLKLLAGKKPAFTILAVTRGGNHIFGHVVGVTERGLPRLLPVHVFDQPDTGQRVYDGALVRATLAILARETGKPVQEDRIGAWLDEIYTDAIRRKWLAQYEHAATEFAETLIRELRPFDSDDDKESLFYDAFDGVDVLPMQFLDEYRALTESEPLRAQELLVSIRSGQYKQILQSRRLRSAPGAYPIVVDVP